MKTVTMLFLATDGTVGSRFQHSCMSLAIRAGRDESLLRRLHNMGLHEDPTTFQDECLWKGVTCDDSKQVKEILWANIGNGNVDIRWLPKSLDVMDWEHLLPFSLKLETRHLPPLLNGCRINFCCYGGHVNLKTLPEQLILLDLRSNEFCGTVHLTHLPSTLQRVQLEKNNIDRVIVSNGLFSERFCRATLSGNSENLRIICLDSSKVDKRIENNKKMKKCMRK